MASPARNTALELFTGYLRKNGLTCTGQRRRVVELILDGPAHFDAEDLAYRVRRADAGVSRATVYRTVNHLEAAGVIRKIDFNEAHAHYELAATGAHHEHLICVRCGKIVEFADSTLEKRIRAMAAKHGVLMTKHRVEIFGICRQCQKR